MSDILRLTRGDCAGDSLAKAGLFGEVFVWHDILYDSLRNPGWPGEETILARIRFLEDTTEGGLSYDLVSNPITCSAS